MLRKIIKVTLISLLTIIIIAAVALGLFIYKVKNGFPIYESKAPVIEQQLGEKSILLFNKTNGFRHGEAIAESKVAFAKIASDNGWSLFETDNGAVFNDEQLASFDLVIWSNVTGRVLKDNQRAAMKAFIEAGGGFMALHGAGDGSHPWPWYREELIGANFSHHSLKPQFQEATMHKECASSFPGCDAWTDPWIRTEEWYTFLDNPRDRGFQVLWTVNEATFNPSGNLGFLVRDKNFGMGDDHPIVWYKCVGSGRSFYSALGHAGAAFKEPAYLGLLTNAIQWAAGWEGDCP